MHAENTGSIFFFPIWPTSAGPALRPTPFQRRVVRRTPRVVKVLAVDDGSWTNERIDAKL